MEFGAVWDYARFCPAPFGISRRSGLRALEALRRFALVLGLSFLHRMDALQDASRPRIGPSPPESFAASQLDLLSARHADAGGS
jgi:hypothetical protein